MPPKAGSFRVFFLFTAVAFVEIFPLAGLFLPDVIPEQQDYGHHQDPIGIGHTQRHYLVYSNNKESGT